MSLYDFSSLMEEKAEAILSGYVSNGKKIEYWDGKTSERIAVYIRNMDVFKTRLSESEELLHKG